MGRPPPPLPTPSLKIGNCFEIEILMVIISHAALHRMEVAKGGCWEDSLSLWPEFLGRSQLGCAQNANGCF